MQPHGLLKRGQPGKVHGKDERECSSSDSSLPGDPNLASHRAATWIDRHAEIEAGINERESLK